MSDFSGLIGLGVAGELSKRLGYDKAEVTTSGSSQGSAGGLLKGAGNKVVLAAIAASDGAVTLPPTAGIGDTIAVFNLSGANDGRVFPPPSHTLQNGTANQYVTLPANACVAALKVTATNWRVGVGAAVVPQ